MCCLTAKKFDSAGGAALQAFHGQSLANLKEKLLQSAGYDRIQLVTVSRPSVYEEYEHTIFWKQRGSLRR